MAGILNAELAFPQFPALDQFGPNTTLLLHGDGTNGAQNNTFLDSSTNNFTITRNGNTTQGTFSPFSQPNGYWSNYFAGSQSINAPASTDFQFAGDFTIEALLYPTSTGDRSVIVQNSGSNYLALNVNAGTGFNIYLNSSGPSISPTDIIPQVNQWNHVALVRSGSTVKVYLNGVASGTTATNSSTIGYNLAFYVGALGTQSSGSAIGYISNVRVVNGTAVYTSNFTPPTSPLTAITNTKLLTCQSNRFLDNSSNAFAITANGTPTVQSFHPISAPTAYYPAVNGGAGYFDGSGDYLATPTSSQPTASGDFTISCWFYLQSFGANYYAVGGNWTSGTSGEWLIQIQNNGTIRFLTTADGTFAGTVRLNEWTYFSASRSGTTVTVQLNGSTIRTYTLTGTLGVANETINIGQQVGNNWPWNGYIADFNFNTTTATTAVPTAPASVVSGTSLLLKFQNAGIIDSVSQNALETVGNAQVSTTQSKFGGASMYFDGTGDYLIAPDNQIYSFGTADFTVECWIYINTLGRLNGIWANGPASTGSFGFYVIATNKIEAAIYGASALTGATSLAASTWYHVAVSRSGSTMRLFVNGNQDAISTSYSNNNTTSKCTVGEVWTGYGGSPDAYIDDLRITKGIARYTQNFTPPQNAYPDYGPLTNIPTVDPNFKNTTLLLHGNGTNGAQNNTFLDSSTNNFTITRNGETTQGTFTPFSQPNGWWSNYLNGSSYLYSAIDASLALGTSDFTVEAWVYFTTNTTTQTTICAGPGTTTYDMIFGYTYNGAPSIVLYLSSTGSSWDLASGVAMSPNNNIANSWNHIALTRSGSTFRTFFNGSQQATFTSSASIYQSANQFCIGSSQRSAGNANYMNGYISNAKVVIGTSLYNSNFTPSTLPLTATTNTKLLTCQSNYFKDNSSNSLAIGASGTPTVQNFYPFFPPLDYSTAAIGGSGYFDGSGDQLNVSPTAISSVGSSDFSFECWVYATRQTNTYAQGLISYGPASVTSTTSCISFQLTNTGYLASTYAAGDSILLTDPNLLVINQWNHCVVCRSGSTISLFKNGARVATSSTSATIGSGGDTLTIGGQWYSNDAGRQLQGYMNGIRIVKGSSAYDATQSTITVPTAPLTAITNTSLLLSCTNGVIFDNASKNDLITLGTAQISTAQSKFGGSSISLPGSSYLYGAANPDFALGTGDFTVEYWVYFNSSGSNQGALVFGVGNTTFDALFGWMNASGGPFVLYLSSNNSSWDIASGVTIIPATVATGQWYHVAITRSGSTFRTFCNGNQQATFTSTASIYQSSNNINIGRYFSGNYLNGYLDDVRVTKGVSRYNYNFTPPAAQFPNK